SRAVDVPEWPKVAGGVPRVERQTVDAILGGQTTNRVDVRWGQHQPGDPDRWGDRLPPLLRRVLDRGLGLVHERLEEQMEFERAGAKAVREVRAEVIRVLLPLWVPVGWDRRGGLEDQPPTQVRSPLQRAAAPERFAREGVDVASGVLENIAQHPN